MLLWPFCRCVTFTSLCGFAEVRVYLFALFHQAFRTHTHARFCCRPFSPGRCSASWTQAAVLLSLGTSDKTAKSQAEHLVPLSVPSAKFPVRFQAPPSPHSSLSPIWQLRSFHWMRKWVPAKRGPFLARVFWDMQPLSDAERLQLQARLFGFIVPLFQSISANT